MVWQSSTNEDTAFPWWYDEGTPLSRTCLFPTAGLHVAGLSSWRIFSKILSCLVCVKTALCKNVCVESAFVWKVLCVRVPCLKLLCIKGVLCKNCCMLRLPCVKVSLCSGCLSVCLSIYLSTYLFIYLSIHLPLPHPIIICSHHPKSSPSPHNNRKG